MHKFILLMSIVIGFSIGELHAQTPICTFQQKAVIDKAANTAKKGLTDAIKILKLADKPALDRYTVWFGAPSSDRIEKVISVYTKALTFFDFQTYRCSNQSKKTTHAGEAASVDPSDPLVVTFEHLFFTLNPTVVDSQSGVLVHEVTHHGVVGDTDDDSTHQDDAKNYGVEPAKKRAKENPIFAVTIADNYQYFLESLMFGF